MCVCGFVYVCVGRVWSGTGGQLCAMKQRTEQTRGDHMAKKLRDRHKDRHKTQTGSGGNTA